MPKWSDVPDEYNWVAMDADNTWCGHEFKPYIDGDEWISSGEMEELPSLEWECVFWKQSLQERPNTFNEDSPTPPYYNNEYKGIKLDPYRVAEIWNIQNNMQFHIFKKSVRMHKENHKTLEENLDDIIKTCQRWKEMIKEDREDGVG